MKIHLSPAGRTLLLILTGCVLGSAITRGVLEIRQRRGTAVASLPADTSPPQSSGQNGSRALRQITLAEMEQLLEKRDQALIQEFREPSTSPARKNEILHQLVSGSLPPSTILSLIDSLPESERAPFLAQLGRSCVPHDPEEFFHILSSLPQGNLRSSVISSGIEGFDRDTAKRLIGQLLSGNDPEDLYALSNCVYHLPVDSSLKPADLMGAAAETRDKDIRETFLYSAGRLDATHAGNAEQLESLRRTWGDDIARQYVTGQFTELETADPARFVSSLPTAFLPDLDKTDLIRDLASNTIGQKGIGEALELGSSLTGTLADHYFEAVALSMVHLNRDQLALTLPGLPPGRNRDVMTAQLVLNLRSAGMADEASHWAGTIADPGLLSQAEAKQKPKPPREVIGENDR